MGEEVRKNCFPGVLIQSLFSISYSVAIQKIPLFGKSSVHEVNDLTSKTLIKEKKPQSTVLIWYFNFI